MKPNIGLKVLDSGKLALVHLATGEMLSDLQAVELRDNHASSEKTKVVATFHMRGITSVGCDYAPPQKKDCGVKLQVDIDTTPFRESLRSLGEDLIKLADKS